jgi:hypothetical protein
MTADSAGNRNSSFEQWLHSFTFRKFPLLDVDLVGDISR